MIQIISRTNDSIFYQYKTKLLCDKIENLDYQLKNLDDSVLECFTECSHEYLYEYPDPECRRGAYVEVSELITTEYMSNEMLQKFIKKNMEINKKTWWHFTKDATNSLVGIVYLLNELAKKNDIKIKCKKIEGRLDVSIELFDEISIIKNDKSIFQIENSYFVSHEFAGFTTAKDLVSFIDSQIKFRKKR